MDSTKRLSTNTCSDYSDDEISFGPRSRTVTPSLSQPATPLRPLVEEEHVDVHSPKATPNTGMVIDIKKLNLTPKSEIRRSLESPGSVSPPCQRSISFQDVGESTSKELLAHQLVEDTDISAHQTETFAQDFDNMFNDKVEVIKTSHNISITDLCDSITKISLDCSVEKRASLEKNTSPYVPGEVRTEIHNLGNLLVAEANKNSETVFISQEEEDELLADLPDGVDEEPFEGTISQFDKILEQVDAEELQRKSPKPAPEGVDMSEIARYFEGKYNSFSDHPTTTEKPELETKQVSPEKVLEKGLVDAELDIFVPEETASSDINLEAVESGVYEGIGESSFLYKSYDIPQNEDSFVVLPTPDIGEERLSAASFARAAEVAASEAASLQEFSQVFPSKQVSSEPSSDASIIVIPEPAFGTANEEEADEDLSAYLVEDKLTDKTETEFSEIPSLEEKSESSPIENSLDASSCSNNGDYIDKKDEYISDSLGAIETDNISNLPEVCVDKVCVNETEIQSEGELQIVTDENHEDKPVEAMRLMTDDLISGTSQDQDSYKEPSMSDVEELAEIYEEVVVQSEHCSISQPSETEPKDPSISDSGQMTNVTQNMADPSAEPSELAQEPPVTYLSSELAPVNNPRESPCARNRSAEHAEVVTSDAAESTVFVAEPGIFGREVDIDEMDTISKESEQNSVETDVAIGDSVEPTHPQLESVESASPIQDEPSEDASTVLFSEPVFSHPELPIVKEESEITKEEPVIVEEEKFIVNSDEEIVAVEADMSVEPANTTSEPLLAEPEPAFAEREPVCNEPVKPVCNEPEPVCNEPDPVCSEPEPVCNEPEPVCNEPDPVTKAADTVDSGATNAGNELTEPMITESVPSSEVELQAVEGIVVNASDTVKDLEEAVTLDVENLDNDSHVSECEAYQAIVPDIPAKIEDGADIDIEQEDHVDTVPESRDTISTYESELVIVQNYTDISDIEAHIAPAESAIVVEEVVTPKSEPTVAEFEQKEPEKELFTAEREPALSEMEPAVEANITQDKPIVTENEEATEETLSETEPGISASALTETVPEPCSDVSEKESIISESESANMTDKGSFVQADDEPEISEDKPVTDQLEATSVRDDPSQIAVEETVEAENRTQDIEFREEPEPAEQPEYLVATASTSEKQETEVSVISEENSEHIPVESSELPETTPDTHLASVHDLSRVEEQDEVEEVEEVVEVPCSPTREEEFVITRPDFLEDEESDSIGPLQSRDSMSSVKSRESLGLLPPSYLANIDNDDLFISHVNSPSVLFGEKEKSYLKQVFKPKTPLYKGEQIVMRPNKAGPGKATTPVSSKPKPFRAEQKRTPVKAVHRPVPNTTPKRGGGGKRPPTPTRSPSVKDKAPRPSTLPCMAPQRQEIASEKSTFAAFRAKIGSPLPKTPASPLSKSCSVGDIKQPWMPPSPRPHMRAPISPRSRPMSPFGTPKKSQSCEGSGRIMTPQRDHPATPTRPNPIQTKPRSTYKPPPVISTPPRVAAKKQQTPPRSKAEYSCSRTPSVGTLISENDENTAPALKKAPTPRVKSGAVTTATPRSRHSVTKPATPKISKPVKVTATPKVDSNNKAPAPKRRLSKSTKPSTETAELVKKKPATKPKIGSMAAPKTTGSVPPRVGGGVPSKIGGSATSKINTGLSGRADLKKVAEKSKFGGARAVFSTAPGAKRPVLGSLENKTVKQDETTNKTSRTPSLTRSASGEASKGAPKSGLAAPAGAKSGLPTRSRIPAPRSKLPSRLPTRSTK